jgi:hypothetical protein
MNRQKIRIVCWQLWSILFLWLAATGQICAQQADYQTPDSPAVSWNGINYSDAVSLSMGNSSIMAIYQGHALSNPALLTDLHSVSFFGGLTLIRQQALQYAGINQGAFRSEDGISSLRFSPGHAAMGFPLSKLSFCLGWNMHDLQKWPNFNFDSSSWSYRGTFNGLSQSFFLATAGNLVEKISIGVRAQFHQVSRNSQTAERFKNENDSLLTKTELNDYHYFSITAGTLVRLNRQISLSAAYHYSGNCRVNRSVQYHFSSSETALELIGTTGNDDFYLPDYVSCAAKFGILSENSGSEPINLIGTIGFFYHFWQQYQTTFFSEAPSLSLKNTLNISLGLEFSENRQISYRCGYRFDPQPLLSPSVNMHHLSIGMGFNFNRFNLDFAAALVSTLRRDISLQHLISVINFSYQLSRK